MVATGTASGGKTMTTGSFTFKANKTYLVFVFIESKAGDSVTFSSTGLGSPTFNLIGTGSENFTGSTSDYVYGRWLAGGNNASGTITVTTVQNMSKNSYIYIVELGCNDTTNPIAQSAYASGNNTHPYTANLTAPPLQATNFDVYLLGSGDDTGATTPTSSPAITNIQYDHGGGTAAAVYWSGTTAPQQNEQFDSVPPANKHWGTIAVELKHF
jgi:hypothetical protein